MPRRPQPSSYAPATAILALGDAFYDPVQPARFRQAILRFRNQAWAEAVGLGGLDAAGWIQHFVRFAPLPGTLPQPLALRYHGHQFRVYNPELGDGRGFLFAQLRDGDGRLLDLGTKGSGRTPYSRFGDGRLTLKGGVREVLASEMLEALGVETSKSFSLVETGEALERNDEPSPARSALLVRLQHSHIRIGTFQRLAFLQQAEEMRTLVDYCLREYYREQSGEDGAPRLLALVADAAARLAAAYVAAGFVHGVLNSDNVTVTGESFDYGPWRFTPYWDGDFTAAYFDQAGLYAFGRQPEAIHWNLVQLAKALTLIAPAEDLTQAIERFPALFQSALVAAVFARLGIRQTEPERDTIFLVKLENILGRKEVAIDRFFFDWRGGRRRGRSPADPFYRSEAMQDLIRDMRAYDAVPGAARHSYWEEDEPCSMLINEVEAIWRRIDDADDWSGFETKIAKVRRMGEAMRSGGA
ncbi:protein adenylyltransferase SelO family protein [Sphingosinicella sp. BN140058]|uniref:protein adenylyltransferase SelO family protein n=1 Tax=Sphingosinicella sp. BN140058 TaxID=1892855 RepID=UPI001010FD25|nr:YdiU family protein [Sphingosinicella sp. BN140058]QAY75209.1 YdiU family protein [Sphingosinicella sp. BN140058]